VLHRFGNVRSFSDGLMAGITSSTGRGIRTSRPVTSKWFAMRMTPPAPDRLEESPPRNLGPGRDPVKLAILRGRLRATGATVPGSGQGASHAEGSAPRDLPRPTQPLGDSAVRVTVSVPSANLLASRVTPLAPHPLGSES
jgi:hypothetical protein